MLTSIKILIPGLLTILGIVFGSFVFVIPAVMVYRSTSMWIPFDLFSPLMAFGSSVGVFFLFLVVKHDEILKLKYVYVVIAPCIVWFLITIMLTSSLDSYRLSGLVIEVVVVTLIYVSVSIILRLKEKPGSE